MKGGQLLDRQRDYIITKVEAGVRTKEIANELSCSQRVVQKVWKRWTLIGSTTIAPRTGRPAILTRRQKRLLLRYTRKYPKIEYCDLMYHVRVWPLNHDYPTVSRRTIYRALTQISLKNFRSRRRPRIKKATSKLRCAYSEAWKDFNYKRVTVKFSDECSVARGSGKTAEWSFGFPSEQFDHNKVTEKDSGRPKQQMVWGSIWCTPGGRVGRSPLVVMVRDPDAPRRGYSSLSYCEALEEGLLPQYSHGQRLMQDNARIHTSKYTKEWLELHGIWVIEHPPYSPDLNPIEHMWWALKRKLHQLHPELDTLGDSQEEWDRFCEGLKEAWLAIPDSFVKKLIHSMPKRHQA